MKCGVVMFSQLITHGRWDAGFLLHWQENERLIQWLRLMYDDREIRRLCDLFPESRTLVDQIKPKTIGRYRLKDLTVKERLVYLAACVNQGDIALAHACEKGLIKDHERNITNLESLETVTLNARKDNGSIRLRPENRYSGRR